MFVTPLVYFSLCWTLRLLLHFHSWVKLPPAFLSPTFSGHVLLLLSLRVGMLPHKIHMTLYFLKGSYQFRFSSAIGEIFSFSLLMFGLSAFECGYNFAYFYLLFLRGSTSHSAGSHQACLLGGGRHSGQEIQYQSYLISPLSFFFLNRIGGRGGWGPYPAVLKGYSLCSGVTLDGAQETLCLGLNLGQLRDLNSCTLSLASVLAILMYFVCPFSVYRSLLMFSSNGVIDLY